MKTGLLSVPLTTFLQKIPTLVLAVISTLLAYQLALLTWSLVPENKPILLWKPVINKNQEKSAQINTERLLQQHLFGEKVAVAKPVVQKAVVATVTTAPKTRLKLTLVGVVAASDPQFSSVIIERKGAQSSYFIDSEIDGTSAVITHIYQDRIILDVKGSMQTLMLDGVETLAKQQGSTENRAQVRKKVNNSPPSSIKTINLDRKGLLDNPAKLTDFVRISPVRENGIIKGYRVKPGKDKSLFEEAGLKNGDLAVELNGIDLTDTQQTLSLMKEFPTMTDMTLSVERDGQIHELYLSIP